MKTARAHRKFAIYSGFLDTILEGEEEVLDGETRKDALKRILKDLEETAAELRMQAGTQHFYDAPKLSTHTEDEPRHGPLPVIDLKFDQIEKDIDNAQTPEDMQAIQKKYPVIPGKFIPQFNKKREELSNDNKD